MGIGFSQYPDDPAIRRRPGLVVEYTVQNSGTQTLVALDRVPDTLGSATLPGEVDPEHAWVFRSGDVLVVSKQGFAPRASFVAAPVIGAREIPPDGTLTGRAVVDVPAQLDVPGAEFTAPRGPVDAEDTSRWQFCLQVVPRPAGATVSANDPKVLAVPFTAPKPEELLCTAATPLTLP